MKPSIVFFDCDGVINLGKVWEEIHSAAKLPKDLDQLWFNQYYENKITNDQWAKNLTEYYEKYLTKPKFDQAILAGIKINPEIYKVLGVLKKNNIEVAIISSGLKDYVRIIAKRLSIKTYRVNAYFSFYNQGKFRFRKFTYFSDDPITKVNQINEICFKLKIDPEETYFVGDSFNDIKAFELTKHGILYKTKNKKIAKYAWKMIDNLEEIIKLI
jgi:HAD superfamily phosphoserine phosphatase-like hydrolase